MTQGQKGLSKLDAELWSPDIAFLLCDSGGLLGERGANLESFGGSSIDYDKHTDQQLGGFWGMPEDARRSGATPAEGHARRTYRIRKRWHEQSRLHRSTHLSHYLGRNRAPSGVVSRFGMFAGVAVAQFEERYARKTAELYAKAIDAARDELEKLIAELDPFESELRAIAQRSEHDRVNGYFRTRAERRELRNRREEAHQGAKPLRNKRDRLLATLAELDHATRSGDPARALLTVCQKGEQEDLMHKAERAVRAAHRAWLGVDNIVVAEAVLDREAV